MSRTAGGSRAPAAPEAPTAPAGPPDQRARRASSVRQRSSSAWQSFLHDRSVRSRVGALVLLPLLTALVLGAIILRGALVDASAAATTETNAVVAGAALDAAHRLQDERDITALAEAGATGEAAVADARTATDGALAELDEQLAELDRDDLEPAVSTAVGRAERESEALPGYREERDAGLDPWGSNGRLDYDLAVDSLLGLVSVAATGTTEAALSGQVATLDSLARAGEAASQERASGALALGEGEPVPAEQQQQLAAQAAEQDFLVERAVAGMDTATRQDFLDLLPGVRGDVTNARLQLQGDEAPTLTPEAWYAASTARLDLFRSFEDRLVDEVVDSASSTADRSRAAAIAAAVLGLLVLAGTIALAIVVARSIVGPLQRLRSAALETADTGLPSLVDRIQADGPRAVRDSGEAVSPEGRDEIGQVATAFNEVHATAVRVASEQAMLRQNLDTIVVNLSRRTQTLVDRQLGEIEGLEARERDPDRLGTLFRIDHLATRVRRHAESLLVLAGVEDLQRSNRAVPILDVVRTAVGEVEQYPRVRFGMLPTDLIAAHAVDDVAHLLAELIDNATEFSAPSTPVTVTTHSLSGGTLRMQVTDAGIGVPEQRLEELNDRLRTPGDIDVAASRTLGLYVVARLAARHGIAVRLVPGHPSGTVAQVDVPGSLVLNPLDPDASGEIPRVPATPRTPDVRADQPEPAAPAPSAPAPATAAGIAGAFQSIAQARAARGGAAEDEPAPVHHRGAIDLTARSRLAETTHPPQHAHGPGGLPRRTPAAAAPGSFAPAEPGPGALPRRRPAGSTPDEAPQPAPSSQPGQDTQAEDDLPIFNAVRSAWFSKGGQAPAWGGATDETWRRAASALEAARGGGAHERARTSGGRPGPAAGEPAQTPSGLPVRRRGEHLVPGALGEDESAPPERDAGRVAASLTSLQGGVSRGREETKGWVPTRPDDSERSTP